MTASTAEICQPYIYTVDGQERIFECVRHEDEVRRICGEVGSRALQVYQEGDFSRVVAVPVLTGGAYVADDVLRPFVEAGIEVVSDQIKIKTRDGEAILDEPIVVIEPTHIRPGDLLLFIDELVEVGLSAHKAVEIGRQAHPDRILFLAPFDKADVEKIDIGLPDGDLIIGDTAPDRYLGGCGLNVGYGDDARDVPCLLAEC